MKRSAILAVLALVALGFTGCGEREQTALYKDGKYRGKPDMRSWDNAPLPYGSAEWKKGDRGTWENEVRERNTAQNEYRRIGH